MGSTLAKSVFPEDSRDQLIRRSQKLALAPETAHFGHPWIGFAPNLPSSSVILTAFGEGSFGLVPVGGVLQGDHGWEQLDSARLPLGDNTLPSTNASAVVHLANFNRSASRTHNTMAIVAKHGSEASAYVYRINPSTDQWQIIPFDTAPTGGGLALSTTLADYQDTVSSLPDSAVHSVTDSWVFVNNDDVAMSYPKIGANEYEEFAPDFLGVVDDEFTARSVDVSDERVLFLNTLEGDPAGPTRWPQRVRWTQIQSKSFTGRGSGALDLVGFKGHGVAIRRIGDKVACYMEDGVAFLNRTFVSTAPFSVTYLDGSRGLLSTHGIVDIGSGQHFGIFSDGWFILDKDGRWTEVGMLNLANQQTQPWREYFYSNLDRDKAFSIALDYSRASNVIRISWPSKSSLDGWPDMVWIYDLVTNTVWPDNYSIGGGTPLCWASAKTVDVAGETWDSATGTWDSRVGESWASTAAEFGPFRQIHGTQGGYVYLHTHDLVQRDGFDPQFNLVTQAVSFGDMTSLKTVDQFWIEFASLSTGNPVTLAVKDNAGVVQSATVETKVSETGVQHGRTTSEMAGFRVTAANLTFTISGVHPIRIHSFAVQVLLDDGGKLRVSDG